MGKPARDAVYASKLHGQERLIMLILADFSQSDHSPFDSWPGVPRIARCADLSIEQTRRYIRSLKAKGIIESYQINRYLWGYHILLPDAAVSAYDTPQFSGMSPDDTPDMADVSLDDTPQFSGMSPDDTPDMADVSLDDTPAYPYGVYRGVSSSSRGVSSSSRGVSSSSRGVSSSSSLLRNERIERIEREENEGQESSRVRENGEMGVPVSVSTMWEEMLTYVRDHMESPINGYHVSREDAESWQRKVRPTMPGPNMICLRGPRAIVTALPFQGVMVAAAGRLYDHRVRLDFWSL